MLELVRALGLEDEVISTVPENLGVLHCSKRISASDPSGCATDGAIPLVALSAQQSFELEGQIPRDAGPLSSGPRPLVAAG